MGQRRKSQDLLTEKILRPGNWPDNLLASVVEEARIYIQTCASVIVPEQVLKVVSDDPDDNKILECAVAAKANFVVTGDKHLLRLNPYGSVQMERVRDFMELLGYIW